MAIILVMRLINSCIFLLLFTTSSAINQTCSLIQPCPANADCTPLTNYCVCTPGFIANCDTKAELLSQYPELIELNPYTRQLFYVKPLEIQSLIDIEITICRLKDKENVPVSLSFWIENGTIQEFLPSNQLNHSLLMNFESQCRTHTVKNARFRLQPNGQSEMLILGLDGNQHKVILSLTAEQKLVQGGSFYSFIVLGLLVFIIALSMISGITLLIRRRRWMGFFSSQGYIVDNSKCLQHFEIFMPTTVVTRQTQKQVCPICLQNIEIKEEIRSTPCQHTFHTLCLDSWCAAHLSCPVCRSDFSVEKIAEIAVKNQSKDGKRGERQLKGRVQVELESREKENTMRQQMLQ